MLRIRKSSSKMITPDVYGNVYLPPNDVPMLSNDKAILAPSQIVT